VLVALTGWGQEGDRHRSSAAGFDSHWVKPLDIELFTTYLERLTGTSQVRIDRAAGAAVSTIRQ
jgi:CheY-like chemotaxis protein